MLSFIVRRLLLVIPMALIAVTVTWGLIRIAPGNFYSSEKKLPPAIEKNIREKYGLDKSWIEQYGIMMWNTIRLDFGESLKFEGQSVNGMIARHFPYSATIGFFAYMLALAIGLVAGDNCGLKAKFRIRLRFDGRSNAWAFGA